MKQALVVVFAVILCASAGAAGITAKDAAWLKHCGLRQSDVNVIALLEPRIQKHLAMVLRSSGRTCDDPDIVAFKVTRDLLRQYDKATTTVPLPPWEYQPYYVTADEQRHMHDRTEEIAAAFNRQCTDSGGHLTDLGACEH